jgi:hypothetical protein
MTRLWQEVQSLVLQSREELTYLIRREDPMRSVWGAWG